MTRERVVLAATILLAACAGRPPPATKRSAPPVATVADAGTDEAAAPPPPRAQLPHLVYPLGQCFELGENECVEARTRRDAYVASLESGIPREVPPGLGPVVDAIKYVERGRIVLVAGTPGQATMLGVDLRGAPQWVVTGAFRPSYQAYEDERFFLVPITPTKLSIDAGHVADLIGPDLRMQLRVDGAEDLPLYGTFKIYPGENPDERRGYVAKHLPPSTLPLVTPPLGVAVVDADVSPDRSRRPSGRSRVRRTRRRATRSRRRRRPLRLRLPRGDPRSTRTSFR